MPDKFDLDRWTREHLIEESAATASRLKIKEVGETGIGESTEGGSRRHITIIESGWGSSGYYPREMLARDGPKVWPAGTHMYLDHPDAQEEVDRPERTLRDLVGTIATDPVMVGNELQAEANIYDHWTNAIDAMAGDIGVSIRAIGESEYGSAEGKNGPIINTLTEGISVDYVTKAGAGGKVGMLIESARQKVEEARNIGEWLEAFIHSTFTQRVDDGFGEGFITREERLSLSAAIGDALDAFHSFIQDNAPGLFERDPFDRPEAADVPVDEGWAVRFEEAMQSLGQAYSVRRSEDKFSVYNTESGETAVDGYHENRSDALKHQRALMVNVPDATESGSGRQTKEGEMPEGNELSELQESVRELQEKDKEREKKLEEATERAERAEDALRLSEARNIVNEAMNEAEVEEGDDALPELPERAIDRVREKALKGKLPTQEESDKLDKDKLTERVHKAWREEAEYLSGGSGNGKVTGMGASESGNGSSGEEYDDNGSGLSEAEEKELVQRFENQGMSHEAAITAARGR